MDMELDSSDSMSLSGGSADLPPFDLSKSIPLKALSDGKAIVASLEQTIRELRGALKSVKAQKSMTQSMGYVMESIAPESLSKRINLKGLTQKPSMVGYNEAVVAMEEAIVGHFSQLSQKFVEALKSYDSQTPANDAITYMDRSRSVVTYIEKHYGDKTLSEKDLRDTLGVVCNQYTIDLLAGRESLETLVARRDQDQTGIAVMMSLFHDTFANYSDLTEERMSYIEKQFNTVHGQVDSHVLMRIHETETFMKSTLEALPNPESSDISNISIQSLKARTESYCEMLHTSRDSVRQIGNHLRDYDMEEARHVLDNLEQPSTYERAMNVLHRLMDGLYLHYLNTLAIYRAVERYWFAVVLYCDTFKYRVE